MTPRTVRADARMRAGRLAKAIQFAEVAQQVHELADTAEDVVDAYVTLCVHAGIAAADVVCAARLGVHARGENHNDAVDLVGQVDRALAKHLDALLRMKTLAGYGHEPVTPERAVRAGRAMDALVTAARATR